MIPTQQTGKMKKLDPATFREKGWQLITDSQAIRSILKAIRVNDDDYRSLYVLTNDQHYPCLFKIWAKRAQTLWNEQELSGKPLILHDYYRNSH